jgi:6-phosphogluconolactonase
VCGSDEATLHGLHSKTFQATEFASMSRSHVTRNTYQPMNHTAPDLYRWHAVADQLALRHAAHETIFASAAQALRQRGQFHLVLAGGNTPRAIYRTLCAAQTDWSSWHIYFGDERCLPPDDSARNSRMAATVWLDYVPIPLNQVHTIPAELGAAQGARMYAETLRAVGDFDLVLLGLGEDGHTASLFPDHKLGMAAGSPDTLAVFDAPKPPAQRVSLSAARLSRARQVLFLVSGEAKHWAVGAWRAGKHIPAREIMPAGGVDVLVEAALFLPVDV